MKPNPIPFAVPAKLSTDLARVQDYWESLKRGENPIPFWDDAKLLSLPDLSDRLMLIDAFERPQRFRLSSVGARIRNLYGTDLEGRFIDEIDSKAPLDFLAAQASASVEGKAPTYFARKGGRAGSSRAGYARLLLPLWGNGRIEMMLGAIEDLK